MTTTPIPIPLQVLNHVQDHVQSLQYSADDSARLTGRLLELWFTIYTEHLSTQRSLESDFYSSAISNVYANIHRDKLAPFCIRIGGRQLQYAELLRALQEARTIDINGSYSVDKAFTKSYRPALGITYDRITTIDLRIDRFVRFLQRRVSAESYIAEHPELRKHIECLYATSVDLEQAFHLIHRADLGATVSYALQTRAIKCALGIHFFTESSTGRLYTSIAGFPKLLLPALRLHGESLIEIDARNCQPLLLSGLIDNTAYATDVESGCFYDHMAHQMGMTRDEFKRLSFEKIFFNNSKITGKLAIALEAAYPGLPAQINALKCASPAQAREWECEPWRFLWHKLQSFEADIFVTTAEEWAGPCLSRHDSLLVPASADWTGLRDQLLAEFRIHDLRVNLQIEHHTA